MNILFTLRQVRTNKTGLCPIMCRLTIKGERLEFSTNHQTTTANWDKNKKRAKGKGSEATNQALNELENKLRTIQQTFEAEELPYSPAQVRDAYKNGTIKIGTWREMYAYYLANVQRPKQAIGENEESTLRKWELWGEHLRDFLKSTGNEELHLAKVESKHFGLLKAYLMTTKKLGWNTTAKIVGAMGSVLKYAHASGFAKNYAWVGLSMPYQKKEINYLTQEEVQKIENLQGLDEYNDYARDLFLLECYTGLAYADLMTLQYKHIIIYKGKEWIEKTRHKNRKRAGYFKASIPLYEIPKAKALIDKLGLPLKPTLNKTINLRLKVIAGLAGVTPKLATHYGRRTFAMHLLNNLGYSKESVLLMLGDKSSQVLENHYAHTLKDRIILEQNK